MAFENTLTIKNVSLTRYAGMMYLLIHDTRIGVPKEDMKSLWESIDDYVQSKVEPEPSALYTSYVGVNIGCYYSEDKKEATFKFYEDATNNRLMTELKATLTKDSKGKPQKKLYEMQVKQVKETNTKRTNLYNNVKEICMSVK